MQQFGRRVVGPVPTHTVRYGSNRRGTLVGVDIIVVTVVVVTVTGVTVKGVPVTGVAVNGTTVKPAVITVCCRCCMVRRRACMRRQHQCRISRLVQTPARNAVHNVARRGGGGGCGVKRRTVDVHHVGVMLAVRVGVRVRVKILRVRVRVRVVRIEVGMRV